MRSRLPSALGAFLAGLTLFLPAAAPQCSFQAITPAQPPLKVEEGERATESQTFQTTALALSPDNIPYIFDTASRIRRVDPDGRMRTVAGNGTRGEAVIPGPALETPLPAIGQIVFSPAGVLHFTATGRVYRVVDGQIEVAAGTGRPGFNGEEGPALDVNLGGIVNAAFTHTGALLIVDGFNRVRRLDPDGWLYTVAGSTRVAAATGLTGDNGPATEAALSNPRQVLPLRDGVFWIKDLSGRHLRAVAPGGIIRTINANFEASVNIVPLADGTPAAATANRLYPIRSNGAIETGVAPFPPFTGTPLAVSSDGALFFLGSARPEQRNPLVRLANRTQTVIAGAPVAPVIDGQAPPFGIWLQRSNSLIYAASVGGKSGILEARPGQTSRFLAGGGDDIGEADGKTATSLTIFGIVAFSVDGEGRIIVADVYRRRILVVGTDGKASVLKSQGGEQIVYAPTGSLSTLQRIAADREGNIYWFAQGATPTGGVFTAQVAVWNRSNSSVGSFTVMGLSALARLEDGGVAVIAGNGNNFRSAYRAGPAGQGEALPAFRLLPLQSVTRWSNQSYFTAASRLFRGEPGRIEWLDLQALPGGASFVPDFVTASSDSLLVHLTDGGFYRADSLDGCKWTPQPAIATNGVVNAAGFEFPNTISPHQLMTVFGTGLGPPGGQGMVLDGAMRATGQPAPYPALLLGNFTGANPMATLTGTPLPVIHSNDAQVTVQSVAGIPASGQYLLYFNWQGLQLIHPIPITVATATPGLFTQQGTRDGMAQARNEDGSAHSAANPAAAGSVIQLFGTGFGALNAALALGDFVSLTNPPQMVNPVSVRIGEQEAEVEFAGAAPGMLGGVYRLDVRIPADLPAGLHEVRVEVPGQPEPSSQRVTIQVK